MKKYTTSRGHVIDEPSGKGQNPESHDCDEVHIIIFVQGHDSVVYTL
jgi:hypothetical protein